MMTAKRASAALIACMLFAGPAFSQDLEWTLTNDSSRTLTEFYTSPSETDDWQNDLLGDGILEAGMEGTVTIADGEAVCEYDLRFVFEDGAVLEDSVNMCEMGSYTITE